MDTTRVLVAFEDERRAYGEVIAPGIAVLRPSAVVATCTPGGLLGGELERFDPQVVICGAPGRWDPGDALAWVELPLEVGRTARVRVGDARRGHAGLMLEGLLGIVDEAEALAREEEDRAGGGGPAGPIRPTA